MTDRASLDDYLAAVTDAQQAHGEYREGQAYFNVLRDFRPELADQIVGTPLDPFPVDTRIGEFLDWLERHW